MNKITKYIDALPLSDAEKSALPDTSLQAVHQALDDDHQTFAREDDSPLGSVKARLAHSWPDSLSGDQLVKDDEGRTQLHAMPKAKRSSMIGPVAYQPGRPLLGPSARTRCHAALSLPSDARRARE